MQLYLIIVQHFVEQHFLANETKKTFITERSSLSIVTRETKKRNQSFLNAVINNIRIKRKVMCLNN